MKKEYKEIRKINADSLQSLCISKRWYTRGDNAAYNHLLYAMLTKTSSVRNGKRMVVYRDLCV